jgi:transposase-like protein
VTPALAEDLRRRRKGKVGRSWYIDETYILVHSRWKYLCRAIDRDGVLVNVMLSEHRDLAAAKTFSRSAKAANGVMPDRVTTDGHDAYPRAIRTSLSIPDASTHTRFDAALSPYAPNRDRVRHPGSRLSETLRQPEPQLTPGRRS